MVSLFDKLTTVLVEDKEEWNELKINMKCKNNTMWYGGSEFDLRPLLDVEFDRSPMEINNALQPNPLYVMTDYSTKFLNSIKEVYANFDRDNFNLSNYFHDAENIEVEQMIPLKLFNINDLKRIRDENTEFHSSVTTSVIPDDEWHFCYINVIVNNKSLDLVIGFIENLVFWKEIIEKYDMKVDVFCALRVGGKSGSWDNTHSPDNGKLFNAIKNSLPKRRPRFWIADDCEELRKIWDEINPHGRGFYGHQHFFKTNYGLNP